jgi:hypothetical protein
MEIKDENQLKQMVAEGWIPFAFRSEYIGSHTVDYGYRDREEFYLLRSRYSYLIKAFKALEVLEKGFKNGDGDNSDSVGDTMLDYFLDFFQEGVDYVEVSEIAFRKLFPQEYEPKY